MLRLFESTRKREEMIEQYSTLFTNIVTTPKRNCDMNGKIFYFFAFTAFLWNCLPAPPVVRPGGLLLLDRLVRENSPANQVNMTLQASNPPQANSTETTGGEVDEELSYALFSRTVFEFQVDEEILIEPEEVKNVESGSILGQLPEGLSFDSATITLSGKLDRPLKKSPILIRTTSTKGKRNVTKIFLQVGQMDSELEETLEPSEECLEIRCVNQPM
jgi:hypothetical protein